MVLFGIPELQASLGGASTDDAKIQNVFTTITSSVAVHSSRRPGRRGRCRPILVSVASRRDCDAVLVHNKCLKKAGGKENFR